MTDFVDLPIESTPQAMLEEVIAELESILEGWEPSVAEYETILFQAIIYRLSLPIVQLAAQVPSTVFNEWGRQVVNVVPQEATAATVTSTWTVQDEDGYTIKAGTQVDVARSGDERIGFVVVSDVEVPPGKTATAEGEVVLEAVEPGVDGNNLEGAGILVDSLSYVSAIALVGASANGADAEDPVAYLGRLAETMQTFIEGVVIGRDVEIVARNVAGVGRALAVDNYNAETETGEQEKTTTVVLTDADGLAVGEAIKEAVLARLAEKREANYLFFAIDATYHEIDVEAVIVPMVGFDSATVVAAVEAAIEEFLDPATFGQQPPGDASSWENTDTLRYQDLVTAINNVEGVDYASTLKWGPTGEALKAEDLALAGVAPLPKPATLTVS